MHKIFIKQSIFLLIFIGITIAADYYRYDDETVNDLLGNEGLNAIGLAKKYGYPLERHYLTTEDGYTLEMHRVPYGINNTDRTNRPPVLIAHGMGGTSAEYLIMGNSSITFRLAEAGYDVWMGNARGTVWSLKHKTYNRRSKQFWAFSWHEIGVYDYTAEIYYIGNVTGQEKVFFLGHSQGSTAFLAMAADRPEMNDRIRLAVLMGPSAYTKHNMSPLIRTISDNIEYIAALCDYLHIYELPTGPFLTMLLQILCKSPFDFVCTGYLSLTMGYDTIHYDKRLIPMAISNLPAGLSIGQLIHFAQLFRDGKFAHCDYGPEENLKRYGSEKAPLYDLNKVTAPVVLMYGATDVYTVPEDAHELCRDLPNCVFEYYINETMFNHVSYLVGNDMDEFVNDALVEMFRKF